MFSISVLFKCFRLLFGLLCVVVLITSLPLFGQTENATISGTITDSTGAVVVGAEVMLTNVLTGTTTSTKSNNAGLYVFATVQPSQYRMVVNKPGFMQLVLTDLTVNVQDTLSRNFKLQLGAISESVTVTANGAKINTESAAVSTVIDSRFVENMPLNGRSFQSLILLAPGVNAVEGASAGNQGEFTVNGQRTEANYFTVDGVSANTGAYNIWGFGGTPQETQLGTTHSLAAVDELQEFRINTSSYSAEYGRTPGGQIAISTKSGANVWHGSLFEYFRNDVLDANNWFNNHSNLPRVAERQNDFGGTLGGPIRIPGVYDGRNKTFFFSSYEGLRLRTPQPAQTIAVPNQSTRTKADPAVRPLLNLYPIPNGADLGDGTAEFTGTVSNPSALNAYSIRIDHSFGDKLIVFGRFADTPSSGTALGIDASKSVSGSGIQTLTVGATSLLSPHLSNEFRFNHTSNDSHFDRTRTNYGAAVPITAVDVFPIGFNLPRYWTFSTCCISTFPQVFLGKTATLTGNWNVNDSLTYTVGSHAFKFGADYRQQTATRGSTFSLIWEWFTIAQLTGNQPSTSSARGYPYPINGTFKNFSAFAEDEWKVTSRLHLSLGLRWDVNPPPTSNAWLPAVTQISNPATLNVAPKGTPVYHTDYRGFAPRFGWVYELNQRQGHETVLRGGIGSFYDIGNSNSLLGAGAGSTSINLNDNATFPSRPADLKLPPPVFQPPFRTVSAPDPHLRLPYTLEWNVAMQQGLGNDQSFTISYVASGGRKLLQSLQQDLRGNPNFVPGAFVSLVENKSSSSYNSLQVQFERRLSQGLQALASYTWSHAIDNLSSNGNWSSAGGTFAQLRRGSADFDMRHNFSAALTYDIPGSYTNPVLGGLLKHCSFDLREINRTAPPVDITNGTQLLGDGQFAVAYPDLTGSALYVSDPSAPGGRVININAFRTAVGPIGNTPRNYARGFGAWQTDVTVRREFPIYERLKMQFRVDAFNLFNHANFGGFYNDLFWGPALFGQASSTLNNTLGGINALYQIGGPRSLQLSLRLSF